MKHIITLFFILISAIATHAAENLTAAGNNLRGPVKIYSVYIAGVQNSEYEFDFKGHLIQEKNDGIIATYTWNNDGTVLISSTDDSGNKTGVDVSFNWTENDSTFSFSLSNNSVTHIFGENGRQTKKTVLVGENYAIHNFHYDSDGNLIGCTIESSTYPTVEIKYTNNKYDEYGNPTMIIIDMLGEERKCLQKFTYYE